jgi:site-specific DNA-methyltransferase (adenine-specific)
MLGDCLDLMVGIEAGSVDLIAADLPYGTTACKWDAVIPFAPLWVAFKRVLRPRGAVVLTASQPFTSMLVMSNLEWFKYCWVWRKSRPAGHVAARLKPLTSHEDICVFSPGTVANGSNRNMTYHPQGVRVSGKSWSRPAKYPGSQGVGYSRPSHELTRTMHGEGYPRSVVDFPNPNSNTNHPTQKPVALFEYLIRTYSDEGETVLDCTMGSGTTGVACINTGRDFIGIERDPAYFAIAEGRIEAAKAACPLFAEGGVA